MTASYFLMALWRMNDSSGMNTYLPLLLKHAGVTKERAMPQASPLVLNTSLRSRRLMLSSLISPKGNNLLLVAELNGAEPRERVIPHNPMRLIVKEGEDPVPDPVPELEMLRVGVQLRLMEPLAVVLMPVLLHLLQHRSLEER